MKWIGITGGIGTGKSTVAEYLRTKGYIVADADKLAHDAVQVGRPGLKAVVDLFGHQFLKPDGSLDRIKLGQLIFSDPQARLKLESVIHPIVQSEVLKIRSQAESSGDLACFYDVPLLFEKNLQDQFDDVILISAGIELQKKRIKERSQLTDSEIEERLQTQLPMEEKEKQAQYVIKNTDDIKSLYKQIDIMLEKIL